MVTEIFNKKYPLLSSLFAPQGKCLGYDPNRTEQLWNQYSSFINSKTGIVTNINLYLDNMLHDSTVQKVEYSNADVSIRMNDFSTHCFVDALSEKYAIKTPQKKRVLPVVLNFNGIKKFTISWINRNRKIIPLKVNKYLPRLSGFLYDEATVIEPGNISIGIIFWSSLKGNKSYLLVQIQCDTLEITENQRQAFIDIYGHDKLKLFDAFWSEKRNGARFDSSMAMEFLNNKTKP